VTNYEVIKLFDGYLVIYIRPYSIAFYYILSRGVALYCTCTVALQLCCLYDAPGAARKCGSADPHFLHFLVTLTLTLTYLQIYNVTCFVGANRVWLDLQIHIFLHIVPLRCLPFHINSTEHSITTQAAGGQSVSIVLLFLWQPSDCIDLFVTDYIFCVNSENKYNDDDATRCVKMELLVR